MILYHFPLLRYLWLQLTAGWICPVRRKCLVLCCVQGLLQQQPNMPVERQWGKSKDSGVYICMYVLYACMQRVNVVFRHCCLWSVHQIGSHSFTAPYMVAVGMLTSQSSALYCTTWPMLHSLYDCYMCCILCIPQYTYIHQVCFECIKCEYVCTISQTKPFCLSSLLCTAVQLRKIGG